MNLLENEERTLKQIAALAYETVRHGLATFDDLRYMFSDIAELTRRGINGRMIGETLRNMVSPPIDSSELLAVMDEKERALSVNDEGNMDAKDGGTESI